MQRRGAPWSPALARLVEGGQGAHTPKQARPHPGRPTKVDLPIGDGVKNSTMGRPQQPPQLWLRRGPQASTQIAAVCAAAQRCTRWVAPRAGHKPALGSGPGWDLKRNLPGWSGSADAGDGSTTGNAELPGAQRNTGNRGGAAAAAAVQHNGRPGAVLRCPEVDRAALPHRVYVWALPAQAPRSSLYLRATLACLCPPVSVPSSPCAVAPARQPCDLLPACLIACVLAACRWPSLLGCWC